MLPPAPLVEMLISLPAALMMARLKVTLAREALFTPHWRGYCHNTLPHYATL